MHQVSKNFDRLKGGGNDPADVTKRLHVDNQHNVKKQGDRHRESGGDREPNKRNMYRLTFSACCIATLRGIG